MKHGIGRSERFATLKQSAVGDGDLCFAAARIDQAPKFMHRQPRIDLPEHVELDAIVRRPVKDADAMQCLDDLGVAARPSQYVNSRIIKLLAGNSPTRAIRHTD